MQLSQWAALAAYTSQLSVVALSCLAVWHASPSEPSSPTGTIGNVKSKLRHGLAPGQTPARPA